MTTYTVNGPFPIEFEKRAGGRTLVFDRFWTEGSPASHLGSECGCYVFAVKTGRGALPIYVGKATKTFKQETFNPSNKHKFHNGFSDYARGKPIMYFIVHPKQRGRTNAKQIGEIEDFLIQAGVARNPDLQNKQGTQKPSWSIKGVLRSGVGRRRHEEVEFGAIFDIRAT